MSLFKKYNGDSDSDGFVLDENENFDELTNVEEKENVEVDKIDDQPQEEVRDEKQEESRKRERDESTLSKKKQKFAELKKRRKERNEQNRLTFDVEKMELFEQSAYFWSYVILENENKQFDEMGIDYPFEDKYIQEVAHPHDDSLFLQKLKDSIPDWKKKISLKQKRQGSPSVLVLCISAIRCTELLKPLSDLGIYIPKLFGKHIKIDQQKKALAKTTPIAIGVPNRVLKLVEEGILDLSNVSLVIIDMKENEKTMNVMSLKETREAMTKLYMKYLHNSVIHGNTKVSFW